MRGRSETTHTASFPTWPSCTGPGIPSGPLGLTDLGSLNSCYRARCLQTPESPGKVPSGPSLFVGSASQEVLDSPPESDSPKIGFGVEEPAR